MHKTLVVGVFMILPISAIINCRIACTQCKEKREQREMLEVYCAMCEECKERRREWLQSGHLNLRIDNENHLRNDAQDLQDDCLPELQDPCEEDFLLSGKTTTTTKTTTSTTTTTRKPCTPKPPCKTKTPCPSVPCLPIMPMCTICPMGSVTPRVSPSMSNLDVSKSVAKSTPESLYFYVGVPKKLLKELKILHS